MASHLLRTQRSTGSHEVRCWGHIIAKNEIVNDFYFISAKTECFDLIEMWLKSIFFFFFGVLLFTKFGRTYCSRNFCLVKLIRPVLHFANFFFTYLFAFCLWWNRTQLCRLFLALFFHLCTNNWSPLSFCKAKGSMVPWLNITIRSLLCGAIYFGELIMMGAIWNEMLVIMWSYLLQGANYVVPFVIGSQFCWAFCFRELIMWSRLLLGANCVEPFVIRSQ